mmetsp:Transcript_10366/g.14281  ORF Transcript_10366/g.14281 Transcript_10366/m.14281 type:complete len:108 (+) Transcript_10366:557-880(+)
MSVAEGMDREACIPDYSMLHMVKEDEPFRFSYSITTKLSALTWAHRLDHYIKLGKSQVHWTQIMITLGIVFFTSVITLHIVLTSLGKDVKSVRWWFRKGPGSERSKY